MVKPEDVALWLVVGFKRSWLLRQSIEAAGLPAVNTEEDAAALHKAYPFLPALRWSYLGRASTPVRAFISAEWPRLFAYLDTNASKPEKLAKAPAQIVKLTCRDARRGTLTAADKREAKVTRYRQKSKEAGLKAATAQRKSHGRSAWNVCKG